MKTIGVLTSVLGGAAAALAIVVGIRSIPDIKRYLKMRSM
jgi:Family of unknown function (DUF6893)